MIFPSICDECRAQASCRVHASPSRVNNCQMTYGHGYSDGQGTDALDFRPVGIADTKHGEDQDESQEELNPQSLD